VLTRRRLAARRREVALRRQSDSPRFESESAKAITNRAAWDGSSGLLPCTWKGTARDRLAGTTSQDPPSARSVSAAGCCPRRSLRICSSGNVNQRQAGFCSEAAFRASICALGPDPTMMQSLRVHDTASTEPNSDVGIGLYDHRELHRPLQGPGRQPAPTKADHPHRPPPAETAQEARAIGWRSWAVAALSGHDRSGGGVVSAVSACQRASAACCPGRAAARLPRAVARRPRATA